MKVQTKFLPLFRIVQDQLDGLGMSWAHSRPAATSTRRDGSARQSISIVAPAKGKAELLVLGLSLAYEATAIRSVLFKDLQKVKPDRVRGFCQLNQQFILIGLAWLWGSSRSDCSRARHLKVAL